MGATNKSKYGNCLSKDHIDIMILPKSTKAAVKIVAVFVSIRLKHYCKVFRETKLDKKVRKKLSRLVLFKNQ